MDVGKNYVGIQALTIKARTVLASFQQKIEERSTNMENRDVIALVDNSIGGGFGFAVRSLVTSIFPSALAARNHSNGVEKKRDFWKRTLSKTFGHSKSNREMTALLESLSGQAEKLNDILNCLDELLAALRDREKKNASLSLRTAELLFLNAEDFTNAARNLVHTGRKGLHARSSLKDDLVDFETVALSLMSAVVREVNVVPENDK